MKVSNPNHSVTNQTVSNAKNKKTSKLDILENQNHSDKSKIAEHFEKQNAAKVNLSDRAQDMKKAKEIALKAPDVNAEKVKKFQELIDKKEYKVDAKKIADKMVDEHLAMSALTEE